MSLGFPAKVWDVKGANRDGKCELDEGNKAGCGCDEKAPQPGRQGERGSCEQGHKPGADPLELHPGLQGLHGDLAPVDSQDKGRR